MGDMLSSTHLQRVGHLSHNQKIALYLTFLHSLTILVRGIWSDPNLLPIEQVEQIKWTNEIAHRIVNRLRSLHNDTETPSDEEIWNLTLHHASQAAGLRQVIETIMSESYEIIGKEQP
jgi:hypothetical protein